MHRSGIAINNHSQTFGAAAAAGALMGLSPRDIRFVLSYAAEQASGVPPFTRDTEHIQKAFGSGRAAQNGVAAKMRALGMTSVRIVNLLGGVMSINYGEKAASVPK